jgi:hypothetical protein
MDWQFRRATFPDSDRLCSVASTVRQGVYSEDPCAQLSDCDDRHTDLVGKRA